MLRGMDIETAILWDVPIMVVKTNAVCKIQNTIIGRECGVARERGGMLVSEVEAVVVAKRRSRH